MFPAGVPVVAARVEDCDWGSGKSGLDVGRKRALPVNRSAHFDTAGEKDGGRRNGGARRRHENCCLAGRGIHVD